MQSPARNDGRLARREGANRREHRDHNALPLRRSCSAQKPAVNGPPPGPERVFRREDIRSHRRATETRDGRVAILALQDECDAVWEPVLFIKQAVLEAAIS